MTYKMFTELIKQRFVHFLEPPYNINWQVKLLRETQSFLRKHPIVIADIGCRGGISPELKNIQEHIYLIGFDADEYECRRLEKQKSNLADIKYYPYFIGNTEGAQKFHLYKNREYSSTYLPNYRFVGNNLENGFYIEKTITVKKTSLDYMFKQESLLTPIFLKLDAQGSELDILKGAENLLKTIPLVEVEVEFTPLYKDQPLFHNVDAKKKKKGFELLYLNRVFERRYGEYQGHTRGQIYYGDALYGKRLELIDTDDLIRMIHYIILLKNYGHTDMAYHLLQNQPKVKNICPSLFHEFEISKFTEFKRRVNFRLVPVLEKWIFLFLHLRKCNQLDIDSDRNWPIR